MCPLPRLNQSEMKMSLNVLTKVVRNVRLPAHLGFSYTTLQTRLTPEWTLTTHIPTVKSAFKCFSFFDQWEWGFSVLDSLLSPPHTMHTFCSADGTDSPADGGAEEVGTEYLRPCHRVGNTSCHGRCLFVSVQSLSALSVYRGCLRWFRVEQEQSGFLCVVCPLPCSSVIFLFNNDETAQWRSGNSFCNVVDF